jgi:alkylated DNA repair dioxygenase AlkB
LKKTRKIKQVSLIEDSDGSLVTYYPNWLPFKKSLQLYDKLTSTLPVDVKYVCVAGRTLPQPRLTSWHGDGGKTYTYSGLTVVPDSWTEELAYLRDELKDFLKIRFNSVLCNYYRDGQDSIGAHSDAEDELGPTSQNKVIASISFGEARNFVLRHKQTKQVIQLDLQFGSLLVMAGTTQRYYTHEVPKTKKAVKPRLNLTYRVII